MSSQGKIQIRPGNALSEGAGVVTNVATTEADLKLLREMAADVTGKTITPLEVYTKRMSIDEGLVVDGDSIRMGDGVVYARNLVRSEQIITDKAQIGNAVIDGDRLDLGPNGELSALSANLGTMTTGQLSVGAGGVVIGNASSGVSISGNVIRCVYGGVTTVQINGANGFISASKFELTADSSSSINLVNGTHYLGTSVTVGPSGSGRTLGGLARVFYQISAPASGMVAGDLWFDSNDGNKPYRYSGSSWIVVQDADIAQALADADAALDAANAAIRPGGGVAVNGSMYITTIDMDSGIVIKSSNSTAKTQMTADGIAIYNSAGTLVVQADHVNGVWIDNISSTPGVTERLSLAYGGNEYGWLAAKSVGVVLNGSYDIQLTAGYDVDITSVYGQVTLSGGVGSDEGVVIEPHIIVGGSSGPTITSGYGSPSSTPPYGSVYLSLGGSFWVYQASGWRRIDNWVD
jgi:hypothetical protein